jgi:hypothetical protein
MTYYEELGVRQDAPVEEIRQAYKKLARLLHPDSQVEPDLKQMAERQMQRLVDITAVLSDPGKRSHYDEMLLTGNYLLATCRKQAIPPPRLPDWRNVNSGVAELALRNWFWILNGVFVVTLGAWTFMHRNPSVPDLGLRSAASQEDSTPQPQDHHPPQKATRSQHRTTSFVPPSPIIPAEGISLEPRPSTIVPPEPPSAPELGEVPTNFLTAPELSTESPAMISEVIPPLPRVSSFAGRWLYTPQPGEVSERGTYSARYIELLLVEHAGELAGDYRARYNVPDRAVSPEVTFKIRGTPSSATSGKFDWSAGDNAKGQAEMVLRTPNLLYVSWWTTDFGRRATLASGTAVLIRLQAP